MISKEQREEWRTLATYSEGNIADVLARALDVIDELELKIIAIETKMESEEENLLLSDLG